MKNIVRKCFALAQIRWASYTGNNKRKGWNADLPDSNITKHAIAAALKELCREKSFDKISIADITSTCGLNRQTFYYHFEDKYELLDWIVYKELMEPLIDGFSFDNMYEHFMRLFTTMVDEKKFYLNAFKIDVNDLSRYINRLAYEQFMVVIDCLEKNSGIKSNYNENMMFAEFLGYGFVGIVFGWAQRGMKDSPEEMTRRLERIINNLIQLASENRK